MRVLVGTTVGVAISALVACHDSLTGPVASTPLGVAPPWRNGGFTNDTSFGALNSPNSGVWQNDSPSGWDGSVERGLIGTFHFPTVITVRTSGTICQVPGILQGYGLCWGPQPGRRTSTSCDSRRR